MVKVSTGRMPEGERLIGVKEKKKKDLFVQ